MRVLALAVMLAAAGCGGQQEDPKPVSPYPDVATLYTAGTTVDCPTASVREDVSDLACYCIFENVSIQGASHCWARVDFTRADPASPWAAANVYGSAANCD